MKDYYQGQVDAIWDKFTWFRQYPVKGGEHQLRSAAKMLKQGLKKLQIIVEEYQGVEDLDYLKNQARLV